MTAPIDSLQLQQLALQLWKLHTRPAWRRGLERPIHSLQRPSRSQASGQHLHSKASQIKAAKCVVWKIENRPQKRNVHAQMTLQYLMDMPRPASSSGMDTEAQSKCLLPKYYPSLRKKPCDSVDIRLAVSMLDSCRHSSAPILRFQLDP